MRKTIAEEIKLDSLLMDLESDSKAIANTLFAISVAIEYGDISDSTFHPAINMLAQMLDRQAADAEKAHEMFVQITGDNT